MPAPAYGKWGKCPPGEFVRLANRLRRHRRRRLLLQVTAAVAVINLMLLVWLLWPSGDLPRDRNFAGIPCSRVRELAPEYAAGRLSPELREQIRRHVAQCPQCQQRFKDMGMMSRALPPAPTKALAHGPDSVGALDGYAMAETGRREPLRPQQP